eukprot:902596-Prymnesium_polylepis.1
MRAKSPSPHPLSELCDSTCDCGATLNATQGAATRGKYARGSCSHELTRRRYSSSDLVAYLWVDHQLRSQQQKRNGERQPYCQSQAKRSEHGRQRIVLARSHGSQVAHSEHHEGRPLLLRPRETHNTREPLKERHRNMDEDRECCRSRDAPEQVWGLAAYTAAVDRKDWQSQQSQQANRLVSLKRNQVQRTEGRLVCAHIVQARVVAPE